MTIIVVNMQRSIILKILPLRDAKDVISPTEAGIKKNAKWSRKKLAKFSTISILTIFDVSKTNNKIIPIMLPGTGKLSDFEIISLINNYKNRIKISHVPFY